jgi:hypothetical protein
MFSPLAFSGLTMLMALSGYNAITVVVEFTAELTSDADGSITENASRVDEHAVIFGHPPREVAESRRMAKTYHMLANEMPHGQHTVEDAAHIRHGAGESFEAALRRTVAQW